MFLVACIGSLVIWLGIGTYGSASAYRFGVSWDAAKHRRRSFWQQLLRRSALYAGVGALLPMSLLGVPLSRSSALWRMAGLSFEEDIALLMQANLEAIGVTLDLKPEPWNRITELAGDAATTPATTQVFNGPSYPSPDSVFYVQYHSASAGTWASMEWQQDPEIDALIDASRATTDVAHISGRFSYRAWLPSQ